MVINCSDQIWFQYQYFKETALRVANIKPEKKPVYRTDILASPPRCLMLQSSAQSVGISQYAVAGTPLCRSVGAPDTSSLALARAYIWNEGPSLVNSEDQGLWYGVGVFLWPIPYPDIVKFT
jgi:hypothetical protein